MLRSSFYVLILLGTALVAGLCFSGGRWTAKVLGCRATHRPHAYLAYCDTPAFGSYEHAAYALDLEPEAVRAMQQAQVLFLGNSRLQFAFSTDATDRFFRQRGISYHLAGFSYGESSAFPRELLARFKVRPRVVIINADPFFQPSFSPAAAAIRQEGRIAATGEGLAKKAFGRLQPVLCRLRLCSGTIASTYRDAQTGQWIWHDLLVPEATVADMITAEKAQRWPADALETWAGDGTSFLQGLAVPRPCVILTGVPTTVVDSEGMAAALGRTLGLPVVQPETAPLTTLDRSHLTAESAERWSSAFLADAAPLIEHCL